MLLHLKKSEPKRLLPYRLSLAIATTVLTASAGLIYWLVVPEQTATARTVSATAEVSQKSSVLGRVRTRRALTAELPLLAIDLKYQNSYTLQQQRLKAIEDGVISERGEDFVSATLTYQSATMPIDLRLKPGPVDALTTKQWPYQVEIENDDRPLGMKRFSLYAPRPESFLAEQRWLNHLQKEGLIAHRTQLVKLSLNGSAQGVFALEDEPSKELIKGSNRPEGVLLHYTEHVDSDTAEVKMVATRPGHLEKYAGLQRQEESAMAQLAAFSEGTLPAETVFDLEATAKYLVIAALWSETSDLHNPRTTFYYNPVTARIEPVGHHYQPNALPGDADAPELSQWVIRLFQDPEFVAIYNRESDRMTDASYLTHLQQELSGDLESTQRLLQSVISGRNPADAWEALNQQNARHEVIEQARALPLQQISNAQGVLSSGETIGAEGRSLSDPTITQLLTQHPFLSWDERRQTLSIRSGSWSVDGDLVIPAGTSLSIDSFVQLAFDADALLIARGPLNFAGEASEPIKLVGKGDRWGGLELWNTVAPSDFRHVLIQNTTAGTLAYRSPLYFENSQLVGSTAREGLKIVDSEFSIISTLFQNMKDDGIDTDGAQGHIENSQFKTIGGDGIDLSESIVSLDRVSLYNIGDKGIAAGQNTTLKAENVQVENAAVALASSDGSTVIAEDLFGHQIAKVGLITYRKRLGFANASITATDVQMKATDNTAIAQSDSTITLNGDSLVGDQHSSYRLYQLAGIPTQ